MPKQTCTDLNLYGFGQNPSTSLVLQQNGLQISGQKSADPNLMHRIGSNPLTKLGAQISVYGSWRVGSWGHTDKRGYNRGQYPSEIPPAFDSEGRFVSAPDFTPRFRADAAGGIGRACIHLMHECTHVRHLGQSVWITDCPRARFWHAACACRASST